MRVLFSAWLWPEVMLPMRLNLRPEFDLLLLLKVAKLLWLLKLLLGLPK